MIKSICAMVLALLLVGYGRAETSAHTKVAGATPASPTSTASPHVTVLPQQLTMPGLNRQRAVRIYVPPGYATSSKRYPVLYMHDGQNLFHKATAYAGEWGVDETLDSLAQTQGLELIVVGIDNGGDKRVTELNAWDHDRFGKGEGKRYMDFIVDVVKPMVDANYRTCPEREHTGVMGSSMGGLISHYSILQYPQVFSKAGIFSPAYWLGPEVFGLTASQPPAADARLALYMGGGEGQQAVTDYQRMVVQMQRQPHSAANLWVKLTPNAAHNEGAWRAEFAAVVM
ncbi:alpha/beta hydrolase [Rhodoferax sp.]|uniref:alpha/beta hydrolase n=1 Tax=Rhodoferax sp. TaxID=50421 RepID=UPI0027494038|nr:alpha/beta hydrolase-fold protein [Rhodoferax sp.]